MNKLSGAEKMVYLICKNMKNYHGIVICGGYELRDYFKDEGIEAYSINFTGMEVLRSFRFVIGIVKDKNVKILHCHDNLASIFGFLIKCRVGFSVKIISHVHSCYPFIQGRNIKKLVDSIIRRKYDLNIFCGTGVMDYYIKNCKGFMDIKAAVLSNVVDLASPLISNEEIYIKGEEFGIEKKDFVIGYVGRLCAIKGIIPFIKEVYKNKNKLKNMKFLIVGSGEQEQEIKAYIRDKKLEDMFIFTGFQKEVRIFYSLMDIFILPSIYEGLPMVLLEAMAEKIPSISMNVGGIGEILDDGRGILIEPGDYTDFVNSICKLYGDEEKRRSTADKGYEYIRNNYSIEKYIKALEKKYEEIEEKDDVNEAAGIN